MSPLALLGKHVPHSCFTLLAVFLSLTVPANAAVPEGFLDVTTLGADPDGLADSTSAIQTGINQARDNSLVLWFPKGTYKVSQRLEIDQVDDSGTSAVVMMGSTLDPAERATIFLEPNSSNFNNPSSRRAVVHFYNLGTADNESGNTDLYHHGFIGIDIRIGSGNNGAVGLRMQGAEGCTIQDVNIDLTQGGHTGVWGVPGSGGTTHNVRVEGGAIGIDTRNFSETTGGTQPQPVLTGLELIHQTDRAIYATARGSLVIVGSLIERDIAGPAIWMRDFSMFSSPFEATVQLIDCIIDHNAYDPSNTIFSFHLDNIQFARSFHFDNVYVRNANYVLRETATANSSGWRHFRRLAVEERPPNLSWGQPKESVWVDGIETGSFLMDAVNDVAPPGNLLTDHRLPANLPSWNTPGAVNVKTLGATGNGTTDDWSILQQAIDDHQIVFLPKGDYRISDTLTLKPDTKLIGAWHTITSIRPISEYGNLFAGISAGQPDEPAIRTADSAVADTYLAFFKINRTWALAAHDPTPPGNYSLEWRCGGGSILRHIHLGRGSSTIPVRPDFVASSYYGHFFTPNYNYPQDSFPNGQWAWPLDSAYVQIRGNGGGRFFNFWAHGRQGLRETTPFLLVENTSNPLYFYHLHLQQMDSINMAEFRNADNVTIFGTKTELKRTMLYFEDCRNVRLFGHGGIGCPDPAKPNAYLFRFVDCDDFLMAGISDGVMVGSTSWIGGIYDRWMRTDLRNYNPFEDQHSSRTNVVIPSRTRPIAYVRGTPERVDLSLTLTNYNVTFAAGLNGSLSGNLNQSITAGQSTSSVTATADSGYVFNGWSGDYTGTDNPLVIDNVLSNLNITANFAVPAALSIDTSSLADATLNSAYNQSLQASGGVPPYDWSLDSGSLPPGLSLSNTGLISGTATALGNYPFTVRLTDNDSASTTRALSLEVVNVSWILMPNGDSVNDATLFSDPTEGHADQGWTHNGSTWTNWFYDSVNEWFYYDYDPNMRNNHGLAQIYTDNQSTNGEVRFRFDIRNVEGDATTNKIPLQVWGINGNFTLQSFQETPSPADGTILYSTDLGGVNRDWETFTTPVIDLGGTTYDYFVFRLFPSDISGGAGDVLAVDNLYIATTSLASGSNFLEPSFLGTDISQSTPWTAVSALAANVDYSGLSIGSHNASGTDAVSPSVSNQFAFWAQNYGSTRTDLADSVTNDRYLSFTLTPQAGYSLDLNGAAIDLLLERTGDGSNAWNAPARVALMTDTAGFSVGNELADLEIVSSYGDMSEQSISLQFPATGYGDLTSTLEVRLYFYAGQWSTNQQISINSFVMSGNVNTVGATGYDVWAVGFSTPADGDENGDGVPNLLAYALGAANTERADAYLPNLEQAPSGLEFQLPDTNHPDVDYFIESCTDIEGSWNRVATKLTTDSSYQLESGLSGVTLTSSAGTITIADTRALNTKRFYRLRVSR